MRFSFDKSFIGQQKTEQRAEFPPKHNLHFQPISLDFLDRKQECSFGGFLKSPFQNISKNVNINPDFRDQSQYHLGLQSS